MNILITSPPYLQAQEYIRSTKLELFWLGFKEDYIQSLSKKEIPYRKVPAIEVFSETFHKCRKAIEENHLLELYDSYFFAGGQAIPIHEIIIQHLSAKGEWVHEKTFVDRIVSRVMFRAEKNPATGLEDERIDREYLVVLRRL